VVAKDVPKDPGKDKEKDKDKDKDKKRDKVRFPRSRSCRGVIEEITGHLVTVARKNCF